jgi:hypothetical protein
MMKGYKAGHSEGGLHIALWGGGVMMVDCVVVAAVVGT